MSQGHVFFYMCPLSPSFLPLISGCDGLSLDRENIGLYKQLILCVFPKGCTGVRSRKGPLKVLRLSVSDSPQMLMEV